MNWIKISETDAIDNEESLAIEWEGKKLALHKLDDEFHLTDNVCTHQYALLSDGYLEDGCVECPLHQAKFCLRTGKAMNAPATVDIKVYPLRIEGNDILADLGQA
ncbi:non-heme iron oxygenase ferredoxin subunit [Alcaligenes faecalis]|uniref:Non-heme iron oxygenase ferredoxin subunit n=1 Tax=Alcaligenes faecalis TaxID=511 RepID=A0ABY7N2B0_ALCFA|nr:non-heme iron oxygenase ferredoxin subunit [Alcaligenes faecalis]WBM37488.1 non-heme iron oxygenase ferredoxin subunit [Alcaligenes faecalis]